LDTNLDTVQILPTGQQTHSVIWLHGLGADGHDFEAIVPELNLPDNLSIGFIFPHAPIQPVTINGGMAMRAWYDITDMSLQRQIDQAGIIRSVQAVSQLIQVEIDKGIPAKNILLAGFSQGGVIALQTGLTYPERLAGIVALSTYLPAQDDIQPSLSAVNREIPIFIAHGIQDPVVEIVAGQQAYQQLKALGYPVNWHQYPMQHSVCSQEVQDISDFIGHILI